MNGAAAQRSATDLGSLTALTDDVDVMSINITCVACCMEGPKVRIARQNDISPFLPLPLEIRTGLSPVHKIVRTLSDECNWAPLKQRMPITEFDGLRTTGIMS